MPRYYIARTSIFDDRKYDSNAIAAAIRRIGGKNVRLALYHGWSNQPKVVCFDAPSDSAADLYAAHASNDVFPKNRSSLIHLRADRKFW